VRRSDNVCGIPHLYRRIQLVAGRSSSNFTVYILIFLDPWQTGFPALGPAYAHAGQTATSMDAPKEEIKQSSTDSYVANPNLSAALKADYLALQNDLQQARELAADFQRQLSGQTTEHALLKQILAKTQNDLAKLQTSIVDLREERHRLANHAFEAIALREKLKRSEQENAKLQKELEQMRARNIPQKAEASDSRARSWWQIKK
jgi:predicted  nucleic acid-binding Zn-ribbon protein